MARAYTRQLSPRLGECELTHIERTPIDIGRARDEHAVYERTLLQCGLELQRLPSLPDSPDGVFVEDVAVLLGDHALLVRSASAARASESASAAQVLGQDFELELLAGGTLDGGDVLRIGKRLYVGLSERTNAAGAEALSAWAGRLGYSVHSVAVRGCLHLKTAVTCAGSDAAGNTIVVANADWIDVQAFKDCQILRIAAGEPFAGNTLRIGDRLLVAAGFPHTNESLRQLGFRLHELEIGELQKAEAGLTCLSLIDTR